MMNRPSVRLVLCISLILGWFVLFDFSWAAPNIQINYQAKLTDASGNNVADGAYDIVFRLYTVEVGGGHIWTESHTVSVVDGVFSTMLGTTTSLSDINFNQTLFLGINVEGDGEMTPRKILGAVPAAFEAISLGGATSTQYLRSDAAGLLATTTSSTLLVINQLGSGGILDIKDNDVSVFTITDSTATSTFATPVQVTYLQAQNNIIFASTTGTQNILVSNSSGADAGGSLNIAAGSGTAVAGTAAGGSLTLQAGSGSGAGAAGGAVNITSGAAGIGGNAGAIIFGKSGAEWGRFSSAGNLGIGTSSPSALVHIGAAASGGNVRIANGWLCVDDNDTCTGATTAGTVYAVGAYTQGADLAENYPILDPTLAAGELVSVAADQSASGLPLIKRAVKGDWPIIGVISARPGLLLGNASDSKESTRPVALSGRVPVRVNLEGGEIAIGDRLTLSSVPGVAKKATAGEETIGLALQRLPQGKIGPNGDYEILTFINLAPTPPSPFISDDKINGFFVLDQGTGRIRLLGALDLGGNDLVNVGAILSIAQNWSLDQNGLLVVKEIKAEKLCLGRTCITESELRVILERLGVVFPMPITALPPVEVGSENSQKINQESGEPTAAEPEATAVLLSPAFREELVPRP